MGYGKSGLISVTPYALEAQQVLVIATEARIRDQLEADIKSSSDINFYERCSVLPINQWQKGQLSA